MKTVHEIFVEALALKQQGRSPTQIANQLVDIGHDNGFPIIHERRSEGGGQPTTIELDFTNGEVIYFDGTDWHHLQ
jgi:hypothetical protein